METKTRRTGLTGWEITETGQIATFETTACGFEFAGTTRAFGWELEPEAEERYELLKRMGRGEEAGAMIRAAAEAAYSEAMDEYFATGRRCG